MGKKLAEEHRLIDIISTKDGVLQVGSSRMILLSAKAYVYLVQSVYEHAPHATKFLLYNVGYRAGQEFMGSIHGMASDKADLMRYAVKTFEQAGYGDFELMEFDLQRPYVRIRGKNLFEASLAEEMGVYRSPRAVDHYSRGMFAGFFSQLLGQEVVCEEMECRARGDDACEFVIMPFALEGPAP